MDPPIDVLSVLVLDAGADVFNRFKQNLVKFVSLEDVRLKHVTECI